MPQSGLQLKGLWNFEVRKIRRTSKGMCHGMPKDKCKQRPVPVAAMPEGSRKRHKRTASENVLANNAFVASKSGGAAQLSDSENEYLGRMSAQKGKKAASARRSRITSNFDPARAKANAEEEEDESDAAQTSPNSSKKKQQKSRKSAGPRLSLGQPTAAETSNPNKQASSSKSKISSEPSIASAISGLSFNRPAASGSKPTLSKSQSQSQSQSQDEEQQKAGDRLAVPPSTGSGQVISARAQRRLAQGKDIIRREWWQSECGVSSTFVAALKRNQFSPLKPGSWRFWGSTKPIMHKHVCLSVLLCLLNDVYTKADRKGDSIASCPSSTTRSCIPRCTTSSPWQTAAR